MEPEEGILFAVALACSVTWRGCADGQGAQIDKALNTSHAWQRE